MVAKWLFEVVKVLDYRPRDPGSSPNRATGIFSPRSLLISAPKERVGEFFRCFHLKNKTASFRGDVEPSILGDLVK